MTSPANGQDWEQIRTRFPVFEHKTYLNSCAYGALAREVGASLQKYLLGKAGIAFMYVREDLIASLLSALPDCFAQQVCENSEPIESRCGFSKGVGKNARP